MSFIHSCVTVPQLRMLLFLFPSQLSQWIKQSQSFQFLMKITVCVQYVIIYTHTYGKYIYTHNLVFSAIASWIMKKCR